MLRNAVGVGLCQLSREKSITKLLALRGGQIPWKKTLRNVTLEWPHTTTISTTTSANDYDYCKLPVRFKTCYRYIGNFFYQKVLYTNNSGCPQSWVNS